MHRSGEQGQWHFSAGCSAEQGSDPEGISLGDVNADSRPDIVVVNQGNNTAAVLFNRGLGLFGSAAIQRVPSQISVSASGDLNNDGLPDLAVTKDDSVPYRGNLLLIYTNLGKNAFSQPVYKAMGIDVSELKMADLNNDGWLDIVTSSRNSNAISVVLNDGNGQLLPPVRYSTGTGSTQPSTTALADLDDAAIWTSLFITPVP